MMRFRTLHNRPSRWIAHAGAGIVLLLTGCTAHRPIVAMMTDYGSRDAYTGVLSGVILSQCPNAQLVTITHEVPDFDVRSASFVLGVASRAYPVGTVFCTVVDPGVGTVRRSLIVRTRTGYTYVGPDNGTFTDVIRDQGLDGAWSIRERDYSGLAGLSTTFHGRDIYGPIAGKLAAGADPDRFGKRVIDPVMFDIPAATRGGSGATGIVRYVDGYGNIVTNIPAQWVLKGVARGLPIAVAVGRSHITAVSTTAYADVPVGAAVVLANSQGLLEVARNQASAAELFSAAKCGARIELRRVQGPNKKDMKKTVDR